MAAVRWNWHRGGCMWAINSVNFFDGLCHKLDCGTDYAHRSIPSGSDAGGSPRPYGEGSGVTRFRTATIRSIPPRVQSIDLCQGWKHRNRVTLLNGHRLRPAAARTQRRREEGIAKRSRRRWTSEKLSEPDCRTARTSVYQGTSKVIWEMSVDYYDLRYNSGSWGLYKQTKNL